MKILVATKNRGKIKEIRRLLNIKGLELVSLTEAGKEPPPVEETGSSFIENSYIKASFYASFFGMPAIADDSGLEVDALGGLPGVKSSRFAGNNATDSDNIKKLINELKKRGLTYSNARFKCCAFLCFPGGYGMWGEGTVEGRIITVPSGSGGFGYDPLFIPNGYKKTFAQMTPEEKNALSHRAKAIRKLKKLLKEWLDCEKES